MAGYTVRSLSALSQAARGFFTQSNDGAVASVWANTFTVCAKVLGLIGHQLELRRAWLVRQIFASTADRTWLIRHGFELDLQPFPAEAASGSATFPALSGTVIPAGLQFARGDGVTFTSLSGETAVGGIVSLPLAADHPGAITNTDPGTTLSLLDPDDAPTGFTGTGTVDAQPDGSGLSGGADIEQTEAFRARVLARKRRQAQGGNSGDYEEWVREACGSAVARVFVDSFTNDARAVWIAFTVNPPGVDAADASAVLAAYRADPTVIFPSAAQIAVAQAYVSDPARRPLQARVFVIPLTPVPVPTTVANLVPDTPDVRVALANELAATFLDRAEPGRPSGGSSVSRSWIDEAVSRATGEDSHVLVQPVGDPSFTAGQLPIYAPTAFV